MNKQTKKFNPSDYFNLKNFQFADIFNNVANMWDAIQNISKYTGDKLVQGKNCQVAKTALIRKGVILGENVKIGHCVEIKNCIIMNNTNIAHLNYVGDSIIGNNVNIGGGACIANLRLDERPVEILDADGLKISTELRKFGAIVGDGCKVGANSVLNPGTILEKNCYVYPLTSVVGYHSAGSVIK